MSFRRYHAFYHITQSNTSFNITDQPHPTSESNLGNNCIDVREEDGVSMNRASPSLHLLENSVDLLFDTMESYDSRDFDHYGFGNFFSIDESGSVKNAQVLGDLSLELAINAGESWVSSFNDAMDEDLGLNTYD